MDSLGINLFQHQIDTINSCLNLESQEYVHVSDNEFCQSSGLYNSYEIHRNKRMIMSRCGIIGNPVGSGKTLICIGLCMNNVSSVLDHTNLMTENYTYYGYEQVSYNTNVIVVPHYLYTQWKETCELAQVPFFAISKKKEYESFVMQIESGITFNIIIVTNTLFSCLSDYMQGKKISRFIVDEADTIKSVSFSRFINAEFTWLVSATHQRLKTHQIFGTRYGFISELKKYITITNETDIEISLPPIISQIFYATMPLGDSIISDIFKEASRALFAGDIETAKDLFRKNNSVSTEENFISLATKNLDSQISSEKNETKLKKWKLRKECLVRRIQTENFCIICYDTVNCNERMLTKCCDVPFCISCIIPWLKNNKNCPYCRKRIQEDDLVLIEKTLVKTEDKSEKSDKPNKFDKFELFKELIDNNTIKTPCIVYSDYTGSFERIKSCLPNKKCFQLAGRITQQTDMLTKVETIKPKENWALVSIESALAVEPLLSRPEWFQEGHLVKITGKMIMALPG